MIGEEMNHLFLFFVPVFPHLLSGLSIVLIFSLC